MDDASKQFSGSGCNDRQYLMPETEKHKPGIHQHPTFCPPATGASSSLWEYLFIHVSTFTILLLLWSQGTSQSSLGFIWVLLKLCLVSGILNLCDFKEQSVGEVNVQIAHVLQWGQEKPRVLWCHYSDLLCSSKKQKLTNAKVFSLHFPFYVFNFLAVLQMKIFFSIPSAITYFIS